MINIKKNNGGLSFKSAAISAVGALIIGGYASCALAVGDGRDIIGPHEYDLPTHFDKPFNIFVQYANIDSSDQRWDSHGDRVDRDNVDTVIGLTKYVRLWVPDWAPDLGLAYEAIVPEVSVRNTTANTSAAGIADPLTGPVVWYKPTENTNIGMDFLVQVPVGDSDVGGGDVWKINSAFFYNINFARLNLTGDIGVIAPFTDAATTGSKPGTIFFTDAVLAYQVTSWLAPFVGATYEHIGSSVDKVHAVRIGSGWETLASGGLYLPYAKNASLTLRYSRGVQGHNHAATNEVGLKFAYVF